MVDNNKNQAELKIELDKARLQAETNIMNMSNRFEKLDKSIIPVNSLIATRVQDLLRIFENVNELSKYDDNLSSLINNYNYVSMQAVSVIGEIEEMEKQHQFKSNNFMDNFNKNDEDNYELIFDKDNTDLGDSFPKTR